MKLTAEDIFPGLELVLPEARLTRVNQALHGLFTKTLQRLDNGLPFIITGDIPAMWLRDSTWQVRPLLRSKHPEVIDLLVELSKSQVQLFLIDPYANAFNPAPNGDCWEKDFADQSPWVFERKFELDSWACLLYLARMIVQHYGRTDHLDANFQKALSLMMKLARQEQHHDPESYTFKRDNGIAHDSLSNGGKGLPVAYTGMIYCAFRPSDDACVYGYLIPSNLFFLHELQSLPAHFNDSTITELCAEISQGISTYGVIDGRFAYEVDGLGNALFMDDANVPSLLSLPYLGCLSNKDATYQKTRDFVLSPANPYYFSGSTASGVGSQHTPKDYVWPISLAIQSLSDPESSKPLAVLNTLETTDADTGSMHESFNVHNHFDFTRPWFSWADMTYVDLVLTSVDYTWS